MAKQLKKFQHFKQISENFKISDISKMYSKSWQHKKETFTKSWANELTIYENAHTQLADTSKTNKL